ncbi:MAG: carbonic anhydrase [Tepidisphaerales bacterium]
MAAALVAGVQASLAGWASARSTMSSAPTSAVSAPAEGPTPSAALAQLRAGNERFVDGVAQGVHRDESRRCETAGGQHPFAAVLSCADSRVPVELLFDVGIGDVFVVRVAGTACGPNEEASLGYAVAHLDVPLLVVLGHTRCGAIAAAAAGGTHGEPLDGLLAGLRPAVDEARSAGVSPGALVTAATRAHVRRIAAELATRPPFAQAVQSGRLRIVPALYDVHSGVVQWLELEPEARESTAPPGANTQAPRPRPEAGGADSAAGGPGPVSDSSAAAAADASGTPSRPGLPARRPLPSRQPATTDDGTPADATPAATPSAEEPSAAADPPSTRHVSAVPTKSDNFLVLGSMMAGATGVSLGIIQWLSRR